jgi:hypothetical protein
MSGKFSILISLQTSTFQIILVSDGKFTFSFFIYGNGMMNWKYNLSMAPPVWIGSSLHSLTYTQPYAFTNKALQLDIMSSVTVEDTGKLKLTNNVLFITWISIFV